MYIFKALEHNSGHWTPNWILVDNGVVLTSGGLRNKIRTTIQQAFEDVLSELSVNLSAPGLKK